MTTNDISKILLGKKINNTCALIPFITAGYPTAQMTVDIIYALDSEGADVIELGIPYADALADGPIIQQASKNAVKQGVYVQEVLDIIKRVHQQIVAPIVVFTYYNPVLVRGVLKFIKEIALAGAKGLIIPDLPIEESDYIVQACAQYNIELILFIAPTSSTFRINEIISKAPGCIYLVSSTGVTGIRSEISTKIQALSSSIKKKQQKLLILGFGISTQQQVAKVSKWDIDGVVIGSAFMKIVSLSEPKNILKNITSFCREVKQAL